MTLRGDRGARITVDGLPNRRVRLAHRPAARRERHELALASLVDWHDLVHATWRDAETRHRRVSRERVRALEAAQRGPAALIDELETMIEAEATHSRAARAHSAIALTRRGPAPGTARRNEAHVRREIAWLRTEARWEGYRALTVEQARAVVCFDERILVVAAAGSGKILTMVAKALYAVERGLVAPERVLMLAFNTAAARQLHERTHRALASIGRREARVEATTFHAFGLAIDARVRGRRARVDRQGGAGAREARRADHAPRARRPRLRCVVASVPDARGGACSTSR